ncbi:hypothetical protein [Mumia sp. DW29H23]|uniref:hypothetical protein n=1 Tax=Mumia sp. DW29H23 TaxID=3421241 RepID=UPI003D682747
MRSTTGRLLRGSAVMLTIFWMLLVVGGTSIGPIELVPLLGVLVVGLVAYTRHVRRTSGPPRERTPPMVRHPRGRKATLWAVICGIALGATATTAVGAYAWATAGPRIDPDAGPGAWGSMPVAAPATVTSDGGDLCLDGEGTAEILDVVPVGALNGMTVTDFGLVAPDPQPDGSVVVLADASAPLHEVVEGRRVVRTISHRCHEREGYLSFMVELRKPRPGEARVRGLDVTYRSAGREHTVRIDADLVYCDPRPGRVSCEEG